MVKVKNVFLYKLFLKFLYFFIINILVFIDFYTKKIIKNSLSLYDNVKLYPFLNFFYVKNYGVAFSLLSGNSIIEYFIIIILSIFIIFVMFLKLYKFYIYNKQLNFSIIFILGGAIGNFIDRINNGYVIDFIDLHIKNYHLAIFNFADLFICLGIFFFIFLLKF